MSVLRSSVLALALPVVFSGCSLLARLDGSVPATPAVERYPDVVAVQLRPSGDRLYDIAVTISSPYDSPQRYADGWRVVDPDGNELGTHTLMHDHAAEQPFTRTQPALHIPAGIVEVTVEGRDQAYGFGGETVTVAVPE